MATYTWNPIPTFTAQQINTPEDADAWISSLGDAELVDGGTYLTDVRIDFVDDRVWLRYTRSGEIGDEPIEIDTHIGGYAVANADGTNVHLSVENEESFNRRYQPYPITS